MNKLGYYSLLLAWVSAVAASIVVLERYANTAGAAAPSHMEWPVDSALQRAPDRPTALFFAHPKCPCTQAAIQEFQRVEARFPGRFATSVVFTVPASRAEDWTETRLVQQARQLQSGQIIYDRDGREAARFQSSVSGQVLLFSPQGRLLFAGGITPARGHEGDNGGKEAFEYMLEHPNAKTLSFPVYGCGLIARGETPPAGLPETRL